MRTWIRSSSMAMAMAMVLLGALTLAQSRPSDRRAWPAFHKSVLS